MRGDNKIEFDIQIFIHKMEINQIEYPTLVGKRVFLLSLRALLKKNFLSFLSMRFPKF